MNDVAIYLLFWRDEAPTVKDWNIRSFQNSFRSSDDIQWFLCASKVDSVFQACHTCVGAVVRFIFSELVNFDSSSIRNSLNVLLLRSVVDTSASLILNSITVSTASTVSARQLIFQYYYKDGISENYKSAYLY